MLESTLTDAEASDDTAHDTDDQQQEATSRGCNLYSEEGSLGNTCMCNGNREWGDEISACVVN